MRLRAFASSFAAVLLLACGESAPPPQVAAPTTAPPAPTTPPEATAKPAAPVELSAEEKKKAEDARQLSEERAKWEESNKAEVARWTDEIRGQAKALAEKSYPNGRAAIQSAMAGKHRMPASAPRDKSRHPVETLDFFGFKPTMTVVDIGPGEGWYTELLAPALAKSGKYVATNGDPNGPVDARPTFYAQRFKAFVDKSSEAYGKVEAVVVDGKAPRLPQEGTVDLVLVMRGLHGMKNGGTLDTWLEQIHKALKPNGVLGIEEHRAAAGADPDVTAKKGYLPEAWVIQKIEAAGFKLAGKSEINANAKDTKDYADGVWTLPPTLRLGAQDRDRYAAIGESDRMTLKFVKVAPKAAPASKAASAAKK